MTDSTQGPAANALRESEYRYRNMFQAMAAAFWELDFTGVGKMLRTLRGSGVQDFVTYFVRHPEFVREMMRATRVLDVNEQTVALFGNGRKEDLLISVEPFWPEVSNHVFAQSVIAAVTGKPSIAAECKLRAVDGRLIDTLFTAAFPPESVAHGKLLIGVIDVSERVRAQEMLQQVQAEFSHAARVSMLGELTASIAHEVNQPLAAIVANASAGERWLARPQPDLKEVVAIMGRIAADAQRAADIISRIRAMASRRAPAEVPLNLNDVIKEAVQFLQHELASKTVAVTLDLAPNLPSVTADRVLLQQVVVNLAVNAIQAMAESQRPRRLSVHSVAEDAMVRISIEDSGPGIAPDQLDRLFDSFYTTKQNGMGMGLPICRSIIESLGGRISAANGVSGAKFSFTLPI